MSLASAFEMFSGVLGIVVIGVVPSLVLLGVCLFFVLFGFIVGDTLRCFVDFLCLFEVVSSVGLGNYVGIPWECLNFAGGVCWFCFDFPRFVYVC